MADAVVRAATRRASTAESVALGGEPQPKSDFLVLKQVLYLKLTPYRKLTSLANRIRSAFNDETSVATTKRPTQWH